MVDMLFRTTQTSALKHVFDPISRLVQQGNLFFSAAGMRMTAMHSSKTCMVSLDFSRDEIAQSGYYEYNRERPIIIGMNFEVLYRALSILKPTDVTTLRLDRASHDALVLQFHNDVRSGEIRINILALDEDVNQAWPQLRYAHIGTAPSMDLHDYVRALKSVSGDNLGIRFVPGPPREKLLISCRGESATITFELSSWEPFQLDEDAAADDDAAAAEEMEDPRESFYLQFQLRLVETFLTISQVSRSVVICVRRDHPLVLEYCPESLGIVRFCCSNLDIEDPPPPMPLPVATATAAVIPPPAKKRAREAVVAAADADEEEEEEHDSADDDGTGT